MFASRYVGGRAGRTVLVTALAIAAVLSEAIGEPAAAAGPCDPATAEISSAEARMLELINDARADAGVPPLVFSEPLNRAAAWMSEHLAETGAFSHTDAYGRLPSERARDCGYPWGAGENLARGSSSPDVTFGLWMDSPGHRANILASYYRVIGIGYYGGVWTVDFGTVLDGDGGGQSGPTPTPTPTAPPPSDPGGSSPGDATPEPSPAVPTPTPTPPASGDGGALVIPLQRGFNLITYAGPALPVREALGGAYPSVTAVYAWDPWHGRWLRYVPEAPGWVNTLSYLQPGEAYFVGSAEFTLWQVQSR